MVTAYDEREWKYEAPGDLELPDLSGVPGVSGVRDAASETLDATYYDTSDLRLFLGGATLRRRVGGHDAGWHVKLRVSDDTRREIRAPLDGTRRAIPAELRQLLRSRARGERLRPVARLFTVRTRVLLLDADDHTLAEIATDEVSARPLGPATGVTHWREIEVELVDGDEGLLRAVDERLRAAGLRRAPHAGKLARALAERLQPATARRADKRPSAAAVVLDQIRSLHARLVALDPDVRADEPDAVHQGRVTARRLRSMLQTYGPLFDAETCQRLIEELRWYGQVLGAVRDDEVVAQDIADELGAMPPELVLGPVAARVTGYFAGDRAAALRRLRHALDSRRYLDLLDALAAFVDEPGVTATGELRAPRVLARGVGRAYRRVARRMERAAQLPAGEQRDVGLHDARKAAKRARYAAEAAEPVFGKDAVRFAHRMKRVQQALGDHHDAVVECDILRQLGLRAHAAGENAFTFGLLWERRAACAADTEERGLRAWSRAARSRVRAWTR
jgi:CHAD domain-containing protein